MRAIDFLWRVVLLTSAREHQMSVVVECSLPVPRNGWAWVLGLLAGLTIATPACDLRKDLEGITNIKAAIKSDVGSDANVSVKKRLTGTEVHVRLKGAPRMAPDAARKRVEALVLRELPAARSIKVSIDL
jgi:hypothetical protein